MPELSHETATSRREPRVLCITGMHRSGTSLTASWLHRCGLPLDDGDVHGATVGNTAGQFEDREFVTLQAQRVRDVVAGSRGWIQLQPQALPTTPGFVARSRELVERRHAKFPVWGWKDPRSALLLEHWCELLPGLRVLALWRSAAEVVESLLARARASDHPAFQIEPAQALASWVAYNRCLLAFKRAHPDRMQLVAIDRLRERDTAVRGWVERELETQLAPVALSELYDERLLNASRVSWRTRLACWRGGSRELESELAASEGA